MPGAVTYEEACENVPFQSTETYTVNIPIVTSKTRWA